MAEDPYDLQRFIDAQAPIFEQAVAELSAGTKRSHWMWFVFPQIAGLGRSATAVRYAIRSLEEARAYLAHPILGPRLLQVTRILNQVEGRSAHDIFGSPDDMKLHSSLTLFAQAAPDEPAFRAALDRYFDGHIDRATLERLAS